MKNIVLFWFVMLAFNSCSPIHTYKFEDEDLDCTFKLWDTNRYTYIERSDEGKYITKGDYTLTDTSFIIICPCDRHLPIGYSYTNVSIGEKNKVKNKSDIRILFSQKSEPVPFATIGVYDASSRLITGTETDINGNATLTFSGDEDYMEISFVGYQAFKIKVEDVRGKNFDIQLPDFKKGGRVRGACFGEYIDYVLTYKVGDNIISANGKELSLVIDNTPTKKAKTIN